MARLIRLGDLRGANSTHPKVVDKTFFLHFGEHAERLRYRTWLRCIEAAHSQIDDIECVEAEVCQVIMNGLAQLLRSERSRPISLCVPSRSDLGHDP